MNSHDEKSFDEGDHLILDISGTCFHIQKENLISFPNSLAWHIWNFRKTRTGVLPKGVYPTRFPNKFFIQRSPIVFAIILQCYNTGKLHVPRWICAESIKEEIKFWKLDSHFTACIYCSDDGDRKDEVENDETSDKFQNDPTTMYNKWKQKKKDIWTFFQNPKSSKSATVSSLQIIY